QVPEGGRNVVRVRTEVLGVLRLGAVDERIGIDVPGVASGGPGGSAGQPVDRIAVLVVDRGTGGGAGVGGDRRARIVVRAGVVAAADVVDRVLAHGLTDLTDVAAALDAVARLTSAAERREQDRDQ